MQSQARRGLARNEHNGTSTSPETMCKICWTPRPPNGARPQNAPSGLPIEAGSKWSV